VLSLREEEYPSAGEKTVNGELLADSHCTLTSVPISKHAFPPAIAHYWRLICHWLFCKQSICPSGLQFDRLSVHLFVSNAGFSHDAFEWTPSTIPLSACDDVSRQ